jgi:hypothetical protein
MSQQRQYVDQVEPFAMADVYTPSWFREFSRPVWAKPRSVEFPAMTRSMEPIIPIDVSWMPSFPSVVIVTYAAVPCGQGMGRGD